MVDDSTFDKIMDSIANILVNKEEAIRTMSIKLKDIKSRLEMKDYKFLLSRIMYLSEEMKGTIKLAEQMYKKAIIDPTGLHSKIYFNEYVDNNINKRRKNLAFIMGDIDKFHDYNADYGYMQGDVALEHIANTFKRTVEFSRKENESIFTARFGGEEFCTIIDNYDGNEAELEERMEQVRDNIQGLIIPAYPGIPLQNDGYKRRTMTLAGGVLKEGEEPKSLIDMVSNLLKDKEILGRNKIHLSSYRKN